jgi:hypothetical protein
MDSGGGRGGIRSPFTDEFYWRNRTAAIRVIGVASQSPSGGIHRSSLGILGRHSRGLALGVEYGGSTPDRFGQGNFVLDRTLETRLKRKPAFSRQVLKLSLISGAVEIADFSIQASECLLKSLNTLVDLG